MSNAKRPRTDEDAEADAKDSKRVLVYRNGNNIEWQVFTVPTSLDKLLEMIGAKFGLQAKRLFTKNGGEVRSVDELRNMDVLYVSSGGDFIAAPATAVPSLPPGDPEWVLLNVGGQYFATTKTTLTSSDPRSKLAGIFSQGPNAADFNDKRDAHGAYLFDRDPVYFKPLLNYLRYKKLVIDKGVSAAGVLEEAKYFGIESLVKDLEALSKGTLYDVNNSQEEERTHNKDNAQPGLNPGPGDRGGNRPLTRDDVIYAIARMPVADIRFQAADFTGADLSSLDLNCINFKWAKLRNCNLSHANLGHCCFEGADLSGAKLEKAQLLGAKMNKANLTGATMKNCVLGQQGDIASNIANLEGADLQDAVLDGSKMYGVNLKGALLRKASMVGCDMRSAVLTGATMVDCNLSSCNLQDVVLG